jgi:hypothetical protein
VWPIKALCLLLFGSFDCMGTLISTALVEDRAQN